MRDIIRSLAVAVAMGVAACSSLASTSASGYFTVLSSSGGNWTYDIHLSNTGTTNIGTFWYAWNPGQDYLPTDPSAVSAPSGWSPVVTHAGSGDGYGIEFDGGTLAAGQSLDGFEFTTTDSPSVITGASSLFSGANVGDSFVYEAAPFSSASGELTITAVPEPGELAPLGILAIGSLLRRKSLAKLGQRISK